MIYGHAWKAAPRRTPEGHAIVTFEPMTRAIFVTGTDTGVGKTHVAAALLRALAAGGARAVGMKPVAAGIEPGAMRSADVAALQAAGNVDAPLDDVNPYAFAPAIAPHLAAARAGASIDLDAIAAAYRRLCAHADAIVVEGAGGALVPLGAKNDMLDIPARLGLPVVLVVGIRLGCLNHALLVGARDFGARTRPLRLDREPYRSGDGSRGRQRPGTRRAPGGAARGGFSLVRRPGMRAGTACGRTQATRPRMTGRSVLRFRAFCSNPAWHQRAIQRGARPGRRDGTSEKAPGRAARSMPGAESPPMAIESGFRVALSRADARVPRRRACGGR